MSELYFIFYKTFLQFLMPLGVGFIGLAAALFLLFKRAENKTGFRLFLCSFLWLWLWSMPVWSDFIRGKLETQFHYLPATMYPEADAIVVLGGGVRGFAGTDYPNFDLNGAADRELFASQLYHAGKASLVFASGGSDPVIKTGTAALAMKDFLVLLGVPDSAIRIGANSRNTIENVKEVANMMKKIKGKSILLVTSAIHMPRAIRLFAHTGLHVVPAPTDFETISVPFRLIRLLPDAEALENSSRAAKEVLGLWINKLNGH
jgi:uncharacterized SAM-binding protein YcdF (DUF218 family)